MGVGGQVARFAVHRDRNLPRRFTGGFVAGCPFCYRRWHPGGAIWGISVDIYTKRPAERNLLGFFLLACFFPRLIADSFVHQAEMMPQFWIAYRRHTADAGDRS
jgi:hypothetical protein